MMAGTQVAVMARGTSAARWRLICAGVRLCNRSSTRLQALHNSGGIAVTGSVDGFASISAMTTNVAEAVKDADVVAMTVPTPALPYYAGILSETTRRTTN
jgi:hypothetical protein